jgi:hypothetical protein
MICFQSRIVPDHGECAICFETNRKLQSFDCSNCMEGAWFICPECKDKIEKSQDSWGNKCPVCREPRKKDKSSVKLISIIPNHNLPTEISIDINSESREKIRCCCLRLPSENIHYLRAIDGRDICIDCGYIFNMLCTFIGLITLGYMFGFYICQKNLDTLCPLCVFMGFCSGIYCFLVMIILLSSNESYFKKDPIRRDKIKLILSIIGTIIYSTVISNSPNCGINWWGYLTIIILFPTSYNCLHSAINCFV